MPVSATYSFNMTRDDIIAAALRLTGRFATGETIPVEDLTNCAQALNIISKGMVQEGLPLWCVQEVAIPLISGQAAYSLATVIGTSSQPVRILDGFLRNSAGYDISLPLGSRFDYDKLGAKSQLGMPNTCFYDPQLGAGNLILHPVPGVTGLSYHAIVQRTVMDFNLGTDNPDFPQDAFHMLKWSLADEIALEYQTPVATRQEINAKAFALREKFFSFQQEQTSIKFQMVVR